jgi:hypothetical protein
MKNYWKSPQKYWSAGFSPLQRPPVVGSRPNLAMGSRSGVDAALCSYWLAEFYGLAVGGFGSGLMVLSQ